MKISFQGIGCFSPWQSNPTPTRASSMQDHRKTAKAAKTRKRWARITAQSSRHRYSSSLWIDQVSELLKKLGSEGRQQQHVSKTSFSDGVKGGVKSATSRGLEHLGTGTKSMWKWERIARWGPWHDTPGKAVTCDASSPKQQSFRSWLFSFQVSSLPMFLRRPKRWCSKYGSSCHTYGRPTWSSRFLVLTQSSPGHCSNWQMN